MPLSLPVTVNARFNQPGDADWYRVGLKKGEGVLVYTTAQRHLRSPVDTLVEVHDSAGKKLADNGSHNDRMHLRFSTQARAVVANYLDCWLETTAKERPQRFDRLLYTPRPYRCRPAADDCSGTYKMAI